MIDLANACGYEVVGLYHYNNERTGQIDHGYRILGSFDDLFEQDIQDKNFLLTMGDMNIRKSLSDKIILRVVLFQHWFTLRQKYLSLL